MQFMFAIAALHVSAIAIYYALGVATTTPERQRLFAWTWIGLTAVVVFGGLQRIKRARRGR